jgi:hypothetical protein
MGFSYYTPVLVYGFIDECFKILDNTWVQENYTYVACYAGGIDENYNMSNIIAISAKINEDGVASYNKEGLSELLHLKEAFEKYHNKKVTLGFHLAIWGDYDERKTYTLDN